MSYLKNASYVVLVLQIASLVFVAYNAGRASGLNEFTRYLNEKTAQDLEDSTQRLKSRLEELETDLLRCFQHEFRAEGAERLQFIQHIL